MNDLLTRPRDQKIIIALLLAGIVLIVYAPVSHFDFVDLDDDLYVRDNPNIKKGLTWDNMGWALTTFREGVWNPATWVSFMLDYRLAGLDPGAFHLTNLLLHAANVVLLFVVLQQMTGALWSSALVAALFALHPLNVESVAWVTERKSVLSTLFGLLTLWAYLGYVRKPCWQRYGGVLGFLVLSLMAKQMLVTLPCVLLMMDYWPLKRLGKYWKEIRERLPGLVAEKLPLVIPVAAASVLTIRAAQSTQQALPSLDTLPFGFRLANAAVAYLTYLLKLVWPANLAVFYPHPGTYPELVDCGTGNSLSGGNLLGDLAGSWIRLPRSWMALVSGDSDSRERPGPGRRPFHGRPPHLYPFYRRIHDADLGGRPTGQHFSTQESLAPGSKPVSCADPGRAGTPAAELLGE